MLLSAGCSPTGGVALSEDQIFAPGLDTEAEAVDGAEVGHRLLAAGEYELAISAFNRAALERGAIDGEILAGLGAANLGLGRLNQAEGQLRRAVADPTAQPEDWNNLGVLLMETGRTQEAVGIFRKAFGLSNGANIAIRDNLRLALAKLENSATLGLENNNEYKLVRRGTSEFVIKPAP
ncbi:MAG: tetratricopeptide repeat protein [Roseobacter sp.]